jgi:serine-type D-Ala-D-Ala carboxypeptidase (penicillin-binding protein 5/6)
MRSTDTLPYRRLAPEGTAAPGRTPSPGSRRRVAVRRGRRRLRMLVLLLVGALIGVGCIVVSGWQTADQRTPSVRWPALGQAAVTTSDVEHVTASPGQDPVPIASVAKLMTAYVVLRRHPLDVGEAGPTYRLTADDVRDTALRRSRQESVVPVAVGERLTELQALQAVLVPSANNVAVALARWTDGSVRLFVQDMNRTAHELGMTRTTYTDPSGFEASTVSTAADQVRLVEAAMRDPVLAAIVGSPSVRLPVAGVVRNTDTLLGVDGFVGVKTGSHDEAGGCFAFRAIREVDGRRTVVTGVVLGQRGSDLIAAALGAARRLVDQLGPPADGADRDAA